MFVSLCAVCLELLEAWPIKCAYAVQEIFKTEKDYIKDLNDMIQVRVEGFSRESMT